MKPFTTQAYIYSLNQGKMNSDTMDEITVIAEHYMFGNRVPSSYIVKYKDIMCTAIFNCYVGEYYADDVFGVVTQYEKM